MGYIHAAGPAENRKAAIVPKLMAAILALALILTPLCAPAASAQGAGRKVRVGYFYNGDFMHKTEDGAYAGYDIEYYYTLAGYAGWELEFVEFPSLKASLDALEDGGIDIMSGLSITPERESKFIVSEKKMCSPRIAVQTRAGDDRFTAGDTASMADLTCGILKASNVVTLYTRWCRKNGLTPHIVEYDSLELRNAALFSGAVDAIAGGSTIAGAQKIAEFPSLDLYFMLNKSRSDLKAELDRAMSILSLENSVYVSDLFEKYFPSTRNALPSFSSAEKAYIAAHPVIRVALLSDDGPLSVKNADGSVSGVLPSYFEHLSGVVGARFECAVYGDRESALAAVHKGEADMMGKFGNDIFAAVEQGVILTVPYLKMNIVRITRAGTSTVSSIAVPECTADAVARLIAARGLDADITVKSNSVDCFALLKDGKTDSVVCTQPAATWLLNRGRPSDYVVSSFDNGTWDVACAMPQRTDGDTLRSILNKTIAVDGGYIDQLIASDSLTDSADFANIFDKLSIAQLASLAVFALCLLIITVVALIVIIRRRRAERQLAGRQAALAAQIEAARAKHVFFGTVSHDMRTPLNGILGFANLALESDDPGQTRAYLEKIRASGAILARLVNDTLLMARLEGGKYVITPEPCVNTELFTGVIDPVRAMAEEKGVEFTDDISALPKRTVMADKLALQKIILNLLTNAVKFTPPGGSVSLSCKLEPRSDGQFDSVIKVSDNGIGMSREFLPHVFEPFAQENGTGADFSGSGLGLAIVKSVADAMGGEVSVASEEGKGSVFTVRLLLKATDATLSRPDGCKTTGGGRLRGRRALVCEDNAFNLEIMRALLAKQGIETDVAENGSVGVEKFAAAEIGRYDIVLLDLRMPVMDGKAAAAAIRALDRPDAGTVPIVAVSADAYPENVQECLDAGMNDHIPKPVDAAELVAVLHRYIPG